MSTLTNAGKIAYLNFLKTSPIHFAFGLGTNTWGTAATHLVASMPENGEVILPHQYVSNIVVTNTTADPDEVGVQGLPEAPNDFYVDYNAGAIYFSPSFAAEGDAVTVTYRHGFTAENPDATDLIDRKLNKLCVAKSWVTPDEDGDIVVDGETFSESLTPTSRLYLLMWLEPEDYPNGTVREVGVFLNPTVAVGTTEGQQVFSPAQITAPGTLLVAANYPAIVRNAGTRTRFHYIIAMPLF